MKAIEREIKELRKRANVQDRLSKYIPNPKVRTKVRKEIGAVRRQITWLEKKASRSR